DKVGNYELADLAGVVDFMNGLTIDYHGSSWEPTITGHNEPLYFNPEDPSPLADTYFVDWSIQSYLGAGVPPDKIVMGDALYTRAWKGVGPTNNGLFQPAQGPAPGTYSDEPGVYDWKDMHDRIAQQPNTYVVYRDDAAAVPFVYAPTVDGLWSSY